MQGSGQNKVQVMHKNTSGKPITCSLKLGLCHLIRQEYDNEISNMN